MVDVEDVLGLALTFTSGLCLSWRNEVLGVGLLNSLGRCPLLVLLGTFVGLALGWCSGSESLSLLGLLDQVIGVRDVVISLLLIEGLAVSIDWCIVSVTGDGFLLIGLGDGFGALLIGELGLGTVFSSPSSGGLLLAVASRVLVPDTILGIVK